MPQTSGVNGASSAPVPLDNEEKAFIEQVTKELQGKVDSYMRKQQQELESMLKAWKTQSLHFLVEERRKLKQPQNRRAKQTKSPAAASNQQHPNQQSQQSPQQTQESQESEAQQTPSSPQNLTEKPQAKRNQRKKGKRVKKFVENDGEQPAETEEASSAATPTAPATSEQSAASTTTTQEKSAGQKKPQQKKRAVKYETEGGNSKSEKVDDSKLQKFTVAELEVFFYQANNSHLKKPIQCIVTSDPETIDVLAAQLIQESDNDVICMNCFWNVRFGEDVNIDAKIYVIGFTCNNKVYLFHLAECEKDLPHKVKELLERDTLYKVAPGIKTDINQLYVDWNRVWVSGILDLNIFVENSNSGSGEESSTLRNQSTHLTALASKVLNYQFNIPNVAKRSWMKDLNAEQLDFAAKVCWLNWKILSTKFQEQQEYKTIRSWVDGALGSYLQF